MLRRHSQIFWMCSSHSVSWIMLSLVHPAYRIRLQNIQRRISVLVNAAAEVAVWQSLLSFILMRSPASDAEPRESWPLQRHHTYKRCKTEQDTWTRPATHIEFHTTSACAAAHGKQYSRTRVSQTRRNSLSFSNFWHSMLFRVSAWFLAVDCGILRDNHSTRSRPLYEHTVPAFVWSASIDGTVNTIS